MVSSFMEMFIPIQVKAKNAIYVCNCANVQTRIWNKYLEFAAGELDDYLKSTCDEINIRVAATHYFLNIVLMVSRLNVNMEQNHKMTREWL